jgi:hypothetical protein
VLENGGEAAVGAAVASSLQRHNTLAERQSLFFAAVPPGPGIPHLLVRTPQRILHFHHSFCSRPSSCTTHPVPSHTR